MSHNPRLIYPAGLEGQLARNRDRVREADAQARKSGIIGPGSITGGPFGALALGSITSAEIQAGTITADNIAALTITAGLIAAKTITANEIATGTITATEIAAGTITAGQIQAGTITAGQIATTTLAAQLAFVDTQLSDAIWTRLIASPEAAVGQLSAVSANMGTLTSGSIVGGNIRTRSPTTGDERRVELGKALSTTVDTTAFDGIIGVMADGSVTFKINADTGTAEFKGTIKSGSTGLGNIGGSLDAANAIADGTMPGAKLVALSVTADQVAADAITAGKILAGAVTAVKIAAKTITADKITTIPEVGGANFFKDPSFEDGTGSWGNSANVTLSTESGGRLGGKLLVTTQSVAGTGQIDSTPQYIPVDVGKWYTASVYGRHGVGTPTNMRVMVRFRDAGDATISDTYGPQVLMSSTEWRRAGASVLAPANATSAVIYVERLSGAANDVAWWDDAQFEEGEVPTAFTPLGGQFGGVIASGIFRGGIFETSEFNPKVRQDVTGLFVTDAVGDVPIKLTAAAGLDLLGGEIVAPAPTVAHTVKAGSASGVYTTSFACPLPVPPGGILANDIVLILASSYTNAQIPTPAGGWNLLSRDTDGIHWVGWKRMVGGETGNVTFSIGAGGFATGGWSFNTYCIRGAHTTTAPASVTTPGLSSKDPPFLNPSTWDVENTLWIVGHADWFQHVTGAPANYSNFFAKKPAAGEAPIVASARRSTRTSSQDPGPFVGGSATSGAALTLAFRPKPATIAVNSDRKIRWVTESGVQVAELFGVSNTGVFEARMTAGAQDRILLNSSGGSSFVQLPNTEDIRLTKGTSLIVVPVGSQIGSLQVTHGLGRTPTQALVTYVSGTGAAKWTVGAASFAATTFAVVAEHAAGGTGGGNVTVSWMLLG